ncbi:MAG: PAS domain-containing protein [Betaproteobacteria bacterium]|nr:PAS domain-containing protein [Betaproteobacteria bacterium]MBI2508727.1 PAS domain-containing protein [Betaproteobacteria bacterium]
MTPAALSGLDLLATAVVLVDERLCVSYMNPAAENLFEVSSTNMVGSALDQLFSDPVVLVSAIERARANNCSYSEHDVELGVTGHARLHLSCTVTPVEIMNGDAQAANLLIEFRHIEQQLRIAREERLLDQSQANRELIRNLAHEIKNPLGGIRGAAQLLDHELERPNLHEYTQVIMKEADRLQALMDRLLTPHRLPRLARINIHEVLERVRSLILAEYSRGIVLRRDYDVSLPFLKGDKEQLIQAALNIVRNAAQALGGHGEIRLRTRIARQVTLARRSYRRAVAVEIWDNGPGVPEELRERIFHPLISGREGGSGLGLTLAQNFVTQHHGMIGFESVPGATCFVMLLPVEE